MTESLHVRVGARVEPADVAVVLPADDERRPAVVAHHLEYLPLVLGLAGVVRADHKAVARLRAKH